jgi:Ca-activated chloride channel family protein
MGIKIYTIGMGADLMERQTFFGTQRFNPSADLDEKTLSTIADKTGGSYFRARSTEELQGIYQLLDQLEPAAGDEEKLRPIIANGFTGHWRLHYSSVLAPSFQYCVNGKT